MDLKNRAFHRSTLFLRALWQQGVQYVVISPGSRSTPLTLAAASIPALKKQVILDERSAAFTALGIGKATNHPAALICTSGTAVANYFPAVIEARKSGVPLLLLTADRPAHLHHSGANQTIDQQHLFGHFPVFFQHIGENEQQLASISRLASQAVHEAHRCKGPAHVNFSFSKPLEPSADFLQSTVQENSNIQKQGPCCFPKNDTHPFRFDKDVLYEIISSERPLIIIGALTAAVGIEPVFELAEWLECPVLSEQGIVNHSHAVQGFEGFLRNEENLKQLNPDLILRFGREPASKSLLQAIRKWKPTTHIHFSDTCEPSDIHNTTTHFIHWQGNYFDANKFGQRPRSWLEKWKTAEHHFFEASQKLLEQEDKFTDAHVYHHLAPKIPRDWTISFSNSFPARDHSMFGKWNAQTIFTNRGVSGIDGITSTALGVSIGSNQAGILFTGDLAFLHDTNALLNHSKLEQPLVIVVINNQGGSIFRMLPVAKHESYFTDYFETPQQVNIVALAQSYGIHAQKVENPEELDNINLQSFIKQSPGQLHIIECVTDAGRSMEIRKRLWNFRL